MAQNNVSILSDVSTCLSDAMDTMFDNNHTVILPENNNVTNHSGTLSVEALKLMMNKRKLESSAVVNEEQTFEENGNDSAKRMCTINGQQYEQKA